MTAHDLPKPADVSPASVGALTTGASATPSGSRATHEAPAGLHPSGFDPSREDATILADAIIRAWERSAIPFDKAHEIQLALVAAKFLVRIADSREPAQSERTGA